jgi:hypothetical protein
MAERLQPAVVGAPAGGGTSGRLVLNIGVIVIVLGVLPFALDAGAAWQTLGPLVAAAFALRGLQLFWRHVCSTDPRHLPPRA